MARYTGPQVKLSRREGVALTDKCAKYLDRRNYPPGEHGRGRIRQSEYLTQLREKQKTRRFYGVLEKQFRRYYEKASRQPGITGENLLRMLELRLDNVVYRLGFAATRRQARQLVNHGHFRLNGKKVNIPSLQVRADDVITLKEGSNAEGVIREAGERVSVVAPWLQADY
ncbi:MAG: 30S ribosomal protein S4, partial [Miltoncostaeaceae bacterium]